MAGSHIERFERWRSRQAGHLAHLVQLVLDEVVPELEAAGLQRHANYAGNLSRSVSSTTIALQRRSGLLWPTVEIEFPLRRKPFLGLTFAMLPETCYASAKQAWKPFPVSMPMRSKATSHSASANAMEGTMIVISVMAIFLSAPHGASAPRSTR